MPWCGLHSLLGRGSFSYSEAPWACQAWHQWAVPTEGRFFLTHIETFHKLAKALEMLLILTTASLLTSGPAPPKNSVWSFNEHLLSAYSVPGTGAIETISQDNK